MIINIRRILSRPDCVLGVASLDYGENIIPLGVTLELPWLNNLPNRSCIPHGRYKAFRRGASKGKTGNLGLSYEIKVDGRIAILIHVGNSTRDTEGCILLGTSFYNADDGGVEIRQSKVAYANLMGKTAGAELLYVDIRECY